MHASMTLRDVGLLAVCYAAGGGLVSGADYALRHMVPPVPPPMIWEKAVVRSLVPKPESKPILKPEPRPETQLAKGISGARNPAKAAAALVQAEPREQGVPKRKPLRAVAASEGLVAKSELAPVPRLLAQALPRADLLTAPRADMEIGRARWTDNEAAAPRGAVAAPAAVGDGLGGGRGVCGGPGVSCTISGLGGRSPRPPAAMPEGRLPRGVPKAGCRVRFSVNRFGETIDPQPVAAYSDELGGRCADAVRSWRFPPSKMKMEYGEVEFEFQTEE